MFRDEAQRSARVWCPSGHRKGEALLIICPGRRNVRPDLVCILWHCSPCEQDVRIYSKLPDVLASEVRADCPCCGRTMRHAFTRQSHASDCSETRYPERIAAWAA
jgi:hypothetical protein